MKHLNRKIWLLCAACLAGMFGLLVGCESDEDTSGDELDNYFEDHPYISDPRTSPNGIITLSPANASVTFIGQTVIFTAVGGKSPYSWDVVNSSGTIGVRADNQGIYTAQVLQPNTVICFDSAGNTAVAQIGAASTNTPVNTLSVSPPAASLAAFGSSVTFTAAGGTPPYLWEVADTGLGGFPSGQQAIGISVTYTRTFPGNNTVTLSDSAGNTKVIPITQP
jgi:hypothetical protein